jgi:hypothetical protein
VELGPINIDEMVRANKQISKLLYKCEDAIDEDSKEKKTLESSHDFLRRRIYQAFSALREFKEFSEGTTLASANNPLFLLIGDAGVGKSHLLADVAKRNIDSAQTCLFLLGQHFTSEEAPWTQILRNILRVNVSERELLASLNARAQAQGCRILFIIDAINEGKGRYFWPDHILSFIRSFAEYEWLSLVLSIRTSYAKLLVPEDLISGKIAIRVQHHGFRDIEYEASSFFFKQYGIEQPSVPLLHPEFSNPLFLKLFCEGLKRAGLFRIPKGYAGITYIIEFFLKHVNKKLSRPSEFDYPEGRNIVRKVVYGLIKAKLERNVDFVDYEDAYAIADAELEKFSQRRRFLDALISEGVLSKNLFWRNKDTYEEGVYLAYERFADHLTASFLLDNYLEQKNPKKAFLKGGNLRRYVDQYYYHQGLLESFSIQIPERINKDLYQLLPKELASRNPIADAFIQSLVWRKQNTITERTHKYVEERILAYKSTSTYDSFFEMVYSVALDPKHPFNAEWLHHYLMGFSLADRDADWTIYLHDKDEKGTAMRRFIDWALSDRERNYLSKESRLLAGKALAWLLPSTNIALRDMATKALVVLFQDKITLLKSLTDAFDDVNDPYVYERIFAAAYGVVLRSTNLEGLHELSSSIVETIFLKETVYPNVLVRDYARNIVEHAIYKDIFKLDEPSIIRPPYRSELPKSFPTTKEIDRKYELDYDSKDFKDYYWSQNAIIRSMTRSGCKTS